MYTAALMFLPAILATASGNAVCPVYSFCAIYLFLGEPGLVFYVLSAASIF
jgi:hypothetical protein